MNEVAENVELTIVCWIAEPKEYLKLFDHFIKTRGKYRFKDNYVNLRSLSPLYLTIPNSSTNYSYLIPLLTSIQLIGNNYESCFELISEEESQIAYSTKYDSSVLEAIVELPEHGLYEFMTSHYFDLKVERICFLSLNGNVSY